MAVRKYILSKRQSLFALGGRRRNSSGVTHQPIIAIVLVACSSASERAWK